MPLRTRGGGTYSGDQVRITTYEGEPAISDKTTVPSAEIGIYLQAQWPQAVFRPGEPRESRSRVL
jgi:hypothetical protein